MDNRISIQWRIQDLKWGGGGDIQRRHFSAETHVKMKELGPVGGAPPPPPGSANAINSLRHRCKVKTIINRSTKIDGISRYLEFKYSLKTIAIAH